MSVNQIDKYSKDTQAHTVTVHVSVNQMNKYRNHRRTWAEKPLVVLWWGPAPDSGILSESRRHECRDDTQQVLSSVPARGSDTHLNRKFTQQQCVFVFQVVSYVIKCLQLLVRDCWNVEKIVHSDMSLILWYSQMLDRTSEQERRCWRWCWDFSACVVEKCAYQRYLQMI